MEPDLQAKVNEWLEWDRVIIFCDFKLNLI